MAARRHPQQEHDSSDVGVDLLGDVSVVEVEVAQAEVTRNEAQEALAAAREGDLATGVAAAAATAKVEGARRDRDNSVVPVADAKKSREEAVRELMIVEEEQGHTRQRRSAAASALEVEVQSERLAAAARDAAEEAAVSGASKTLIKLRALAAAVRVSMQDASEAGDRASAAASVAAVASAAVMVLDTDVASRGVELGARRAALARAVDALDRAQHSERYDAAVERQGQAEARKMKQVEALSSKWLRKTKTKTQVEPDDTEAMALTLVDVAARNSENTHPGKVLATALEPESTEGDAVIIGIVASETTDPDSVGTTGMDVTRQLHSTASIDDTASPKPSPLGAIEGEDELGGAAEAWNSPTFAPPSLPPRRPASSTLPSSFSPEPTPKPSTKPALALAPASLSSTEPASASSTVPPATPEDATRRTLGGNDGASSKFRSAGRRVQIAIAFATPAQRAAAEVAALRREVAEAERTLDGAEEAAAAARTDATASKLRSKDAQSAEAALAEQAEAVQARSDEAAVGVQAAHAAATHGGDNPLTGAVVREERAKTAVARAEEGVAAAARTAAATHKELEATLIPVAEAEEAVEVATVELGRRKRDGDLAAAEGRLAESQATASQLRAQGPGLRAAGIPSAQKLLTLNPILLTMLSP